MNVAQLICFVLFFAVSVGVKSQMCLTDIELDKISQDKIQEYLESQQEHGIIAFSDVKPSLNTNSDVEGFLVRENTYQIKKDFEEVWSHYLNTNPSKAWNGKKVSFGFLFSKKENRIVYCNDEIQRIDTGMVVYLNLRLMSGLKNLATAFEFITIDKENKMIEFSYLSGNVSVGKQRIQFRETRKGYTRILHTSFYRSNNIFKNYLLYPYFHTRTTNEFHRNLKKLISNY
jgi:hypothetical protein